MFHTKMVTLGCVFIILTGLATIDGTQIVNVTIMVPDMPMDRLFSTVKVKPAIVIGLERVKKLQLLPTLELNVSYVDTKCNAITAPVESFRVMNAGANALFGPVCDYSLSPVARYVPIWNLPIITMGGFANDFGDNRKTEYTTLTRASPAYFSVATNTLLKFVQDMKWNRAFLITEKTDSGLMFRYWYLLGSAVVHTFEFFSKQTNGKFEFDKSFEDNRSNSVEKTLKEKISTKFSSKFIFILAIYPRHNFCGY